MRSATVIQRTIDVLGDRCFRLECSDLLQESTHDIEAALVTVWMLAGGTDSNPIQDQRRLDRPRTLLVTPICNEAQKKFLSVFETSAILAVVMRIGLRHCTFQSHKLLLVGRQN